MYVRMYVCMYVCIMSSVMCQVVFCLGSHCNKHIGVGCQFPRSPGYCEGNRIL